MTVALVPPDLSVPMPSAVDAERAVLGSVLILNASLYRVTGIVSAADFYNDANRTIFTAMATLAEEGTPIETLTVAAELRRTGQLELCGGVGYISSLMDQVPNIAQVELYAAMIAKEAKKRALVTLGNRLMREGLDAETEPEAIAADALASLGQQATREDRQARPLVTVLTEAYEAQEALRKADRSSALACGYPLFDEHKVFSPTLVVAGAPSKGGKTALAVNLAYGLARNGHRNVIATLESSPRQLGLRYTSMRTGVPHSYLRDWRVLSDANFAKIAQCRVESAKLGIFMSRGPRTAEDIVLELRRLKAVEGIECAFVDYIQLVDLRRRLDREERLSEVSQLFLATAIDLGITIFAFSQLNEDRPASRSSNLLSIGDLAYAKAIGKSARVVVLFQRPKASDPNDTHPDCFAFAQIAANNEERTHPGFEMHFTETTQRWGEGGCKDNECRLYNGPTERSLFGG